MGGDYLPFFRGNCRYIGDELRVQRGDFSGIGGGVSLIGDAPFGIDCAESRCDVFDI